MSLGTTNLWDENKPDPDVLAAPATDALPGPADIPAGGEAGVLTEDGTRAVPIPSSALPLMPPPYPGDTEFLAVPENMRRWQQRLVDRGNDLPVTSEYDARSAELAHAIQQAASLPATGEMDRATWDATWTLPVSDGETAAGVR